MTTVERSGFVAVVGRPNVGKSTLINRLVGQKVSITTPRPQTTRHRVLGIVQHAASQLVFIDTPGIHRRAPRALNRTLNRTALAAIDEADVILWVCEAARHTDDDERVFEALAKAHAPIVVVLNKVDLLPTKETLLPRMAALGERRDFDAIVPLSARRDGHFDGLLDVLAAAMPTGPALFAEDAVTDRSIRFLAAELIREKLTLRLNEEIPYGSTVIIDDWRSTDGRTDIAASIVVEKNSHKPIVIGAGGARLKEIGSAARRSIEALVDGPVNLQLWVRVRDNWADSEAELNRLGFD
ncbi:MAG: GTPase Era [Pseudomonadota bacterium]